MQQGFEAGTNVGGYLAGDVIGAGGASVAQRAWATSRIGRTVALKVLDGAGWDPAVRERFEREVRMGGGLTHPNIVPVLDAGEQDGRPYLVMQLHRGPTLARSSPVTDPCDTPGVKIASDIAAALDYAHGRGVIHRDVEAREHPGPRRHRFGRLDHAYLADFGITRAAADAELAGGSGVVLGTPAYIAPEQRAGTEVDGRADVYALACVIFEMLAGSPPFGAIATARAARCPRG